MSNIDRGLEGVHKVSGRYLVGVWKVSGGCTEIVWRMFWRFLQDIWGRTESGHAKLEQAKSGQVRSGHVMSRHVKLEQIMSEQVMSGQVESGFADPTQYALENGVWLWRWPNLFKHVLQSSSPIRDEKMFHKKKIEWKNCVISYNFLSKKVVVPKMLN